MFDYLHHTKEIPQALATISEDKMTPPFMLI